MLAVALALLLAAEPLADPARAELDRFAVRIERLKGRQLAGEDVTPELERLLVRAQELAQRIERERRAEAVGPAAAPGPTPEELRERADALRDERDRIAGQLRELDARIDAVRRERRVEAGLESLSQERALFGDPGASRVSPGAAPIKGPDGEPPPPPEPGAAPAGVLFGPRAGGGGDEKGRGSALQRLDRLRVQRAQLLDRQAVLETEAAALDAEARSLVQVR
jgi:hypothetical protein